MALQRYLVRYGTGNKYVLWDDVDQTNVLTAHDKSTIIAEAQTRNHFTPVDGNEATYAAQTKA